MSYFNKLSLLLFFLIFTNFCFSQKVFIIDADNGNKIVNATVFSKQNLKSVISNINGEVDLSSFSSNDSLVFGHISYKNLITQKKSIKGSIVSLQPAAHALNEVVLSVARSKESKEKISKKVSVLSSDELMLNNPQTSADLLTYTSGIRVQKSQGGGGSPSIRGFEANRILLVIDGVRMNNAIYRSGHLQNSITISPYSLERTEIIYGPSSVGYGSDALGGVIHYFTKTPRLNNTEKWIINGLSSYNTRLKNSVQNFDIEHSSKRWASYTNFSFSKFGDIIMGSNRNHGFESWGLDNHSLNPERFNESSISNNDPKVQKHTGYEQFDFLHKFNFKLTEFSNMVLNFQKSQSSKINRYDKLNEMNEEAYKFAEWYYGPQDRTLASVKIKSSRKNKLSDSRKILFAYQKIKESRHARKFNQLLRTNQLEKLDIFSLNIDLQKILSNNSSIAYGFEFAANNVYSDAYQQKFIVLSDMILSETNKIFETPTRYPSAKGSYNTSAIYYEIRKDISQNSNINIGMRYTNTHLEAKWDDNEIIKAKLNDVTTTNSSLTTSIGFVYRPKNKWKLNANFSSGFRSPNIDDIGKIREQKGILSVPNSSLKPEYAYNSEIGISNFSDKTKSGFSLNVYYTHISKHIMRDFFEVIDDETTSDSKTILFDNEEVITMANVNRGNGYIYGSTLDFRKTFTKNLYLKGNVSYTFGKNTKLNQFIPSISPVFGRLTLNLSHVKSESEISYKFSGSKSPHKYSLGGEDGLEETPVAYDLKYGFHGMPSWGVLKISSSYVFSENLKTTLILDNLFDIHYREFASGISAPGRNLNIVLSYRF